MQFQPQTITIKVGKNTKPVQLSAMVAIGHLGSIGLAYHESLDGDPGTFDVTHIESGCNVLSSEQEGTICEPLPTEDAVQRFITLIAPLADWHLSRASLRQFDRATVIVALKNAYQQVLRSITIFTTDEPMHSYTSCAMWLLPDDTESQWFHDWTGKEPRTEDQAKQDVLKVKPDAVYVVLEEFAQIIKSRQEVTA